MREEYQELLNFGIYYTRPGTLGNLRIDIKARDQEHAIEIFKEKEPEGNHFRVFQTKE